MAPWRQALCDQLCEDIKDGGLNSGTDHIAERQLDIQSIQCEFLAGIYATVGIDEQVVQYRLREDNFPE